MIHCEKCSTRVDKQIINSKSWEPCTQCGALIRTDIFPAAVTPEQSGPRPEGLVMDDDAGCFYHPTKKAVIACSLCGRFLCSLCDIDMDGSHICFPCMESGQKKKSSLSLEKGRFLYDGLALRLSILPLISLFFTWATCITAPIALYISLRYWKSDTSIAPRKKRWRNVTAMVLSLGQIACWAGLVYYIIQN